MESLELKQQISVLQAHIDELSELLLVLNDHPVMRGLTLIRLVEQANKLRILNNTLDD